MRLKSKTPLFAFFLTGTNVQDGAVIHCTYQRAGTDIGNNVNIGHQAIVHGCTIRDHVLIGMGAIVMDRAVVEEYCIIAAGTVILENTVCECYTVVNGEYERLFSNNSCVNNSCVTTRAAAPKKTTKELWSVS